MPTSSTTLEILVKLRDEASAAMQGMSANLKSVGDSITSVGKTMTTDITLPLVAFGAYAIKGAMDFQQAMTLVQTQAGASATEVADLSQQVMDLARSSQQGPTELAQGLYHLISLGLDATDAMNALKISSEGAAVGQANLEDVATALGGAISSGIKGTSDYEATMGILNATVGAGNMKMTDLVAALGTGILPAAKSAGLAIQDVSAALATMTDNGIPAEDAATRLRMTFSLLSAPTKEAQDALKTIGISSTQLANDMRQPNGLLAAVMDLKTHLEDSGKTAVEQNAIIAKAFGGGRTSSAIETLLEETDRLKSKYADLATGVNSFAGDVTAQNNTWAGQLAILNSNFQVFRDTVGISLLQIAGQILPVITNALQDLVGWWEKLSPGMQKAIIYAAMFAAAIGPVLLIIGTLITAIGSIIGFIGGFISIMGSLVAFMVPVVTALGSVVVAIGIWPILIGAAVIAVVALIVTHWNQITAFLSAASAAISGALKTAWDGIKSFFQTLWDDLVALVQISIDFIVGFIVSALVALDPQWFSHWNAMVSGFKAIYTDLKTFLVDTWNWIVTQFTTSLNAIDTVWKAVWGGISSFFIGIWDGMKSALTSAISFLQTTIMSFVSWASGVFSPVLNAVNAIGGAASSFAKLAGGFANGVGGVLSGVAATGASITHFATGGIVNGPTFALVGEAGPEAIIPLSAFNNGLSLSRGSTGNGGGISITINGGQYYTDRQSVTDMANQLAKIITQQIKVRNYAS